jgi:hypothetical protein
MGSSSAGRRRFPAPRPQRYDKEKFLQANFRFLVSSEYDVMYVVMLRKGLQSDAGIAAVLQMG